MLKKNTDFELAAFLSTPEAGQCATEFKTGDSLFRQGQPANSVFYLQRGRAKLTVIAANGKEATITLIPPGNFVGEESLIEVAGFRLASATAITPCTAIEVSRNDMFRFIHDEPSFSELFLKFLLSRSMRSQADLIDQLFNSCEKRLARILLLMAEFGETGDLEASIPPITHETLADMIGATRSRVNFFMNRFRRLGFISYNGHIQVHKSLLNVVLNDHLPGDNSQKPLFANIPGSPSSRLRRLPNPPRGRDLK